MPRYILDFSFEVFVISPLITSLYVPATALWRYSRIHHKIYVSVSLHAERIMYMRFDRCATVGTRCGWTKEGWRLQGLILETHDHMSSEVTLWSDECTQTALFRALQILKYPLHAYKPSFYEPYQSWWFHNHNDCPSGYSCWTYEWSVCNDPQDTPLTAKLRVDHRTQSIDWSSFSTRHKRDCSLWTTEPVVQAPSPIPNLSPSTSLHEPWIYIHMGSTVERVTPLTWL